MKRRDYYEQTYWDRVRRSRPSAERRNAGKLAKILTLYLPESAKILDIGCGDGSGANIVQMPVSAYVGIDLSMTALKRARQVDVRPVMADVGLPIPFESAGFNVALCTEVLEHLFDPETLLDEVHRLLEPEGVLLISVPNIAHFPHRIRLLGGKFVAGGDPSTADRPWRDPHIRFFTRQALVNLLNSTGFSPVRTYGLGTSLLTGMPILSVLLARLFGPRTVERLSDVFEPLGRWWPSLFAGHILVIAKKLKAETMVDGAPERRDRVELENNGLPNEIDSE